MKGMEEAIRPEALRLEYWDMLEREVARFQRSDGKVRPELLHPQPCSLCGSSDSDPYLCKRGFQLVRCHTCGLIRTDPAPNEALLQQFYNSEALDFMQTKILESSRDERLRSIHEPRAKEISQRMPTGRLIEIGCSVGVFLEAASNIGNWELYGIEPSRAAAESTSRRLNIKVFNETVERLDLPPGSFDVAVCWEVIEHLPDPCAVLRACRRLLRSGGLLALSTPNIEGFDMAVLQESSRSVSPPGHLTYFTPSTLALSLTRSGFESIEVRTPGNLDVEILAGELRRHPELISKVGSFLARLGLEKGLEKQRIAFQNFLRDYGMSSHMIAYAYAP